MPTRPDSPKSAPSEPRTFGDEGHALESSGTTEPGHQEALLDEAIEETFPASDPISPSIVS